MTDKFVWYNPATWGSSNIFKTSNKVEFPNSPSKKNATRRNLPPGGRSSKEVIPSDNNTVSGIVTQLKSHKKFIEPPFMRELIPIVRSLAYSNPDISQAVKNIVDLVNTDHKIIFDSSVKPKDVDKMRDYLSVRRSNWMEGQPDIHGIINKWATQIMIGGALSNEWVIKNDLSGIKKNVLINPESIVWSLDKRKGNWTPYQKLSGQGLDIIEEEKQLIRLNTYTYKYFAINGDTSLPYGIPPYLPALKPISRQVNMDKNIDFVVDMMGVLGFLEALIDSPDQYEDENDDAYAARKESLLNELKTRMQQTLKDGVVAGYKDEHEFEFHSSTKDTSNFKDLYQENEYQIGSAINQDLSLLGRSYSNTETQITVLFSKLLSQLGNCQKILKANLEFGYKMELILGGFNFKNMWVRFDKSTVTDELKYQQGLEIKIRNLNSLYNQGIINQDQYADELHYDKPDQKEPRIQEDLAKREQGRKDREDKKNESDKKGVRKKQERPKD